MEELLKLLNACHPLVPELQVKLFNCLPKEIFRANKVILDAGEICDWIAFVEKGLLKIYHELEDGTERVIWYHKEGDVLGSMKSFYSNIPSKLSIRALGETVLRKIRKQELDAIYRQYTEFNINGRMLTERYYGISEDHVILMTMPPKERYKMLRQDYPWMLSDPRIKDYMLAAYLGIDKATLSRYRHGK
jgi:CRP-like cAMP-binding protein